MAVPANFTEATGRDHWEVLLRARAIENGSFVLAAAQCGTGGGVQAHGRSMIVDPWGIVLAQAPDGPGIVLADLELERVMEVQATAADAAATRSPGQAAPWRSCRLSPAANSLSPPAPCSAGAAGSSRIVTSCWRLTSANGKRATSAVLDSLAHRHVRDRDEMRIRGLEKLRHRAVGMDVNAALQVVA